MRRYTVLRSDKGSMNSKISRKSRIINQILVKKIKKHVIYNSVLCAIPYTNSVQSENAYTSLCSFQAMNKDNEKQFFTKK